MDCAVSMAWHSQNSQDLGNANRRSQDKPFLRVLILSESSQFSLLQQRNIVKPREKYSRGVRETERRLIVFDSRRGRLSLCVCVCVCKLILACEVCILHCDP
jgi:hypothetical protein